MPRFPWRALRKERSRAGEAETVSKISKQDKKSASQRDRERYHSGAQGPTKDQLNAEARKPGIEGRSSMNKIELAEALGR